MNTEEKVAFGEKIRKYRKDRGLSQDQVAEGICHPSTVSQLERGVFTASRELLKKICEKLDASELLDEIENEIDSDSQQFVQMNSEEKLELGQKIRIYRKEKGMTQEQLAEGICHPSTVSQMERGVFTASGEILKKICDKLGIGTNDLLEEHMETIDADALLDIIKIHFQREEYEDSFRLIQSLKERNDLAAYQRQELYICEADYLMRIGNTMTAIEYLSGLQRELVQKPVSDYRILATVYNKLGIAFYKTSRILDAYTNFLRAYETCTQLLEFDMLAANICYNMGNACRQLGKDTEGLSYVTQAQKFYENTADIRKLADALFVIGISYRNLKAIDVAAEYLQKALYLYETQDLFQLAEEVRYAYAYLVLSQTDPNSAIEELEESEKRQEQSAGNRISRAYTYALAASIYLDQKEFAKAKIHIDKSLELFTDEMVLTERKLVFVYYTNAKYLLSIGEINQAIKFAYKCVELYDNMRLARDAADSLMILKDAYEMTGDLVNCLKISDQIIARQRTILDNRMFLEGR